MLIADEAKRNWMEGLDRTVNYIQSHALCFLLHFRKIDELMRKSYRLRAKYGETLKAARKATHEQEMSEIELAAARMRREVTDTQLEKARLGLLGVDYDGISGLAMDE